MIFRLEVFGGGEEKRGWCGDSSLNPERMISEGVGLERGWCVRLFSGCVVSCCVERCFGEFVGLGEIS